jgi:hypothetical protein
VGADGEASDATGIDGNQDNNNAIDYGAVYMTSDGIASQWVYIKDSSNAIDFGKSTALSEDRSTMAVGEVLMVLVRCININKRQND